LAASGRPRGNAQSLVDLFEDGSGGRGDVSRAQRDRRIPLVSQPRRAFPADDGTPLGWIGINFDIEERKEAEAELRRSKAY